VRELRADNRKREGQRPKDNPSSHRTEWYADPGAPDSRLALESLRPWLQRFFLRDGRRDNGRSTPLTPA
jgi:hypothetical protein